MKHGYARCSTVDQSLDIQTEALARAGCEKIWSEKKSGASRDKRAALDALLAALQPGDELWITKIDRLARSIRDLANMVADLKARGVALKALDQNIDTSTPAGRAFCSMLGIFAEFEREMIRERQASGIAKAKADGRATGRPATIDAEQIRALKASGMSAAEVMAQTGISRASFYRVSEAP